MTFQETMNEHRYLHEVGGIIHNIAMLNRNIAVLNEEQVKVVIDEEARRLDALDHMLAWEEGFEKGYKTV